MRRTVRIPASGTHVLVVPRDELQALLDRVGEESKELLLLREIEGHTFAEMSEMTGLSVSAVKMRVQRAKTQFDALLLAKFRPSSEIIELTEQSERLISELSVSPTELLKLSPREFEELIAE